MSRPSPDVVGRRLDDRFVLVNLRTNRIYELNATASVLWDLLESGFDGAQLESEMLKRFDVEPEELRREIDGVVQTMADAGLLTDAGVVTA